MPKTLLEPMTVAWWRVWEGEVLLVEGAPLLTVGLVARRGKEGGRRARALRSPRSQGGWHIFLWAFLSFAWSGGGAGDIQSLAKAGRLSFSINCLTGVSVLQGFGCVLVLGPRSGRFCERVVGGNHHLPRPLL
jgi:hypothetical protein